MAPLRPTHGISGSLSSMPDFSARPMAAAVTATLMGVICAPPPDERRWWTFLRVERTMGAVRGMASRMVGMAGEDRTSAVDVLRAMGSCYPLQMSSATDSQLRENAERSLAEAIALMGIPAIVGGWDVSGDDYWEQMGKRTRKALEIAKRAEPFRVQAEAARKIRDAARQGLDKSSQASTEAKATLAAVAAGAGVMALGPGILLGVIAFLVVESTGFGKRARSAGRRYVSARARSYGF